MSKKLLFGAIASVLTINAYAVSSTVTSKQYVDTTRQATIPASGTNSETPGETVVTYTSTAGTIGERGIYEGNLYNKLTDANKLVTADVAYRAGKCVYNSIPNIYCTEYDSNNNCLLMGVAEPSYSCDEPWNAHCTTDADCGSGHVCDNHECMAVAEANPIIN
ncbi:MAG: hypothetical protein IJQ90_02335 [Alphaproteobacteria bacterium]|nr:hypothetical protein [Alphaproteobacteria bacterium]